MNYWDYYRDDFGWNDDRERVRPDYELTRARFADMGYTDGEVEAFIRSGYVVLPGAASTIIDRFYGGALTSSDDRTRILSRHFKSWFDSTTSSVPVHRATSLAELRRKIDEWRGRTQRRLLFRGQTEHYALRRERQNPRLSIPGIGEVSLLPSLWRELWRTKPMSFATFAPPDPVEWQLVLSHRWPLADIDRRVAQANEAGDWIHSYQDMEDSDDELLREYGRLQNDILMGASYNLADLLSMLLQHYGLRSPVLDLTSDLDVALFFATHRLIIEEGQAKYHFVGNNGGAAVLYVFREDPREMNVHGHDRVVDRVKPLRPLRQSCVICRSGPFALNLASDFVVGILKLEFNFEPNDQPFRTTELFPGQREDLFLDALKSRQLFAERLLDFSFAE